MTYYRERKKYKPVLDRAKTEILDGISLSQRGNILLSYPCEVDARLEIIFGWANERVTHLNLHPNEALSQLINHSEDTANIEYWIESKLAVLFGDVSVPDWSL
jgi:hypothetical protein